MFVEPAMIHGNIILSEVGNGNISYYIPEKRAKMILTSEIFTT